MTDNEYLLNKLQWMTKEQIQKAIDNDNLWDIETAYDKVSYEVMHDYCE